MDILAIIRHIIIYVGCFVVYHQVFSFIVLLIMFFANPGSKISIVVAYYDQWWGTYYDIPNNKVYWMIPFVGLRFSFGR